MSRNPVEHAALPKEEKAERNIWTAEMLFKALDVCDDDEMLFKALDVCDDDRRMNAQRFEETFYSTKKEDAGKEQEKAANSAHESDQELLMKPEMAALLKALAKRL